MSFVFWLLLLQRIANPYDLGPFANFEQVFGYNVLLWFIPVPTTPGNGLSFPVNLVARMAMS